MADSTPMPGNSEFSADQEQQQRAAQDAAQSIVQHGQSKANWWGGSTGPLPIDPNKQSDEDLTSN